MSTTPRKATASKAAAPKAAAPKASDADEAPAGSNTAVPAAGGDHDRVQMLSLKADGTPDQTNPELIGDVETTLAATKQQFVEQAVSAVDAEERSGAAADVDEDAPQDPTVQALKDKHDAAAAEAEQAAEAAVAALHPQA